MTFDEFFKKKRIDLEALQKAEPVLFSEFKDHYGQMGEKSFDHTKKYWFNKVRRQYPLAPEIKTEKPHIANPLAEQTVTESLTEQAPAATLPKLGFTPKFRGSAPAKPVEEGKKEEAVIPPVEAVAQPKETIPESSFKPKFKATTLPKQVADEKQEETEEAASTSVATPGDVKPKLGFTPKFRAAAPPKQEDENTAEAPPANDLAASSPAKTPPKTGYKPRFVPPKKTGE